MARESFSIPDPGAMPRKFEDVDFNTDRLPVPGGWLVRTTLTNGYASASVHTLFISDPDHTWLLQPPEAK